VRSELPVRPGPTRKSSRIDGLGGKTSEFLRRLEIGRYWPGYVGDSLAAYERFLRKPGRILYVPYVDYPCCDPVDARDQLQHVLDALPAGAGRDLRRLVARLDSDFERRTLPDPSRAGGSAAWWRHRIQERT
jgi:hypothetical protein